MKIRYKLTNKNLTTYMGFQWALNEWKETSGKGDLCTNGWLHCYNHPLLAIFLNPVHADIERPRIFKCEVEGKSKTDKGLKEGWSRMRLVEEIEIPKITRNQKIVFGILCALKVSENKKFIKWAKKWLSNRNSVGSDNIYLSCSPYASDDSAVCAARSNNVSGINYYSAEAAEYAIYRAARKKIKLNLIKIAEKSMKYN